MFRRRVLLLVAVVILMITIALLLICSKQIYPNRPSLLLDFEDLISLSLLLDFE